MDRRKINRKINSRLVLEFLILSCKRERERERERERKREIKFVNNILFF